MRKPANLASGDRVALLSTARAIDLSELENAIGVLESWGLKVEPGKSIGARDNQFAGSDELRAQDLQAALDDPEIKAIFCARGGYGSIRIIDKIDFTRFTQEPKWFIGYSDVTVFHTVINQYLGIQSLHASMPISYSENTERAIESIRKAVFGEPLFYEIDAHKYNRQGVFTGEFGGGNMSILYALLGTKYGWNASGKGLFIEDLDEYLYHVDRMAQSFEKGNRWKELGALIVGGMTDMNDNSIPFGKDAEEIIWEHVKDFEFPVCFNFPAGHIKDNCAIPFGAKAELNVGEEGSIIRFS